MCSSPVDETCYLLFSIDDKCNLLFSIDETCNLLFSIDEKCNLLFPIDEKMINVLRLLMSKRTFCYSNVNVFFFLDDSTDIFYSDFYQLASV